MPFAIKAFGDDARAVCQLAQDNILRHLVDGTALPLLFVGVTGAKSSLSLLEALSRYGEGDGGETHHDVENDETDAEKWQDAEE